MALRWNPQTNQFEDDTTGAPFAGQPPPALQAVPPGVGGGAPPQVMPMPAAPPSVVPPPAPPPMERYSSSTTRDIVTPEERATQKRIGQVDQEAVNIAGQKGDVDIQKAKDEAEAAKQRATARQGFEQQTVAGVDQGAAESARAKAVYDAENAKLSTMQIKDYGEDKSAWTKAAAVVSLALGAIGGAMSGRGGNAAVDQLNKVIDDDYRKQRAQIDLQERKVAGAKENVGLVRQSVSDQRADLELKQAARWNSLGGAIDAKAAQNATPDAQAQAAAMKNLAEQKALEHLQRWQEGARAKVTSTNVQGTGAAGSKSMNNDTLVYGPGGEPIAQARTPKEAEKANAANAAFRQLDGTLEALHKSYSEHGVSYNPLSDEFQNQKALKGAATIAYKNAAQLGALSGPDMGLVENAIGGAWVGKQGAAKLEAARNTLASSHVSALDSQGLPGKQIVNTLRQQQGPAATPLGGGGQQVDQAKVQMARQRLAANPNDKVAKDWLAAHGL